MRLRDRLPRLARTLAASVVLILGPTLLIGQVATLERIEISGNQRVDDASVRALLGLREGRMPRPECIGDAYMGDDELPMNLADALDLLAEDVALRDVLGPEFCAVYDSVKRNEYKEFQQVISPWEREHLLLNV